MTFGVIFFIRPNCNLKINHPLPKNVLQLMEGMLIQKYGSGLPLLSHWFQLPNFVRTLMWWKWSYRRNWTLKYQGAFCPSDGGSSFSMVQPQPTCTQAMCLAICSPCMEVTDRWCARKRPKARRSINLLNIASAAWRLLIVFNLNWAFALVH